MLGAIIGDLAASTYEKDKDFFYWQLISPCAELSEYGSYYMRQLGTIMSGKGRVAPMPFLKGQEHADHDARWRSGMVMLAGIEAWMRDVESVDDVIPYPIDYEKPDWYAYRILRQAVYRMRLGDTKHRVVKGNYPMEILDEDLYQQEEPYYSLSLLCRSWRFFRDSFDFTSAIHNAARGSSDKDRHVNCMYTGLLAEAMYGTEGIMIKERFKGTHKIQDFGDWSYSSHFKCLSLENQEVYFAAQEHIKHHRIFFPKNSARTNVERHSWTPLSIPSLENIHFSKEARRRILKSFYTGWDNRYGFYWDDGWFYSYRSFNLIGRFRLSLNNDGTYSITQIQTTNENLDIKTSIEETLYPTLYCWDRFGDEDIATTLKHMFKFFVPEVENTGDENHLNHWWLWEKMAWENVVGGGFDKISDWWKLNGGAGDLYKKHPGFCSEELCLMSYFTGMLGKWFPYSNVDDAIQQYVEF